MTEGDKCNSCKAYPKDFDSHTSCYIHRDCINSESFTWFPKECSHCTFLLRDHKKKPKDSGFSYLVGKLVKGRKSLGLTDDNIFEEPVRLECLDTEEFIAAFQSSREQSTSGTSSSSKAIGNKLPNNKRPRVEDEDFDDNEDEWDDIDGDLIDDNADIEQNHSKNDFGSADVVDLNENEYEDWFQPIELDDSKIKLLTQALARTRGVYKCVAPDLNMVSADKMHHNNDPKFCFPMTYSTADLITQAENPSCTVAPTLFDVKRLSFISEKFPELQEFCLSSFINGDGARNLNFLNNSRFLGMFDKKRDHFNRRDLINSIFVRELSILIQAALNKGADKPKLIEALKDLCTLLIEVSSINLFSRVKSLGASRRAIRRKIFGNHYSSVAAKLIEGSLISGQLFSKADAEKANTSMGLQTINVGNFQRRTLTNVQASGFRKFQQQRRVNTKNSRFPSSNFRGSSSGNRGRRSKSGKSRGGSKPTRGFSSSLKPDNSPKSQ